jgi:hypothetical protein
MPCPICGYFVEIKGDFQNTLTRFGAVMCLFVAKFCGLRGALQVGAEFGPGGFAH